MKKQQMENCKAMHKGFNYIAAPMVFGSLLLAAQPVNAGGVQVSGALEIEAGTAENYGGTVKTSDVVLATAALAFDGSVNKQVDYHIAFLYEEDDTPLELDEGIITIKIPRSDAYIAAGQMYVPFGNYTTAMVSDPLTLEIGETRETALQFGFETDAVYGSVYAFNGELDEAGEDSTVSDFGANLGVKVKSGSTEMDFGVSYTSNLSESDGISGNLTSPVVEFVSGMGVHAVMNFGSFQVVAEYVAADQFDVADLSFNGVGAEPTAFNIEFAYTGDVTFGVAYQGTEEALNLGLPESKVLAAVSFGLFENTNMAFEYSSSDDYEVADGGTGESANAFVMQLAVEF